MRIPLFKKSHSIGAGRGFLSGGQWKVLFFSLLLSITLGIQGEEPGLEFDHSSVDTLYDAGLGFEEPPSVDQSTGVDYTGVEGKEPVHYNGDFNQLENFNVTIRTNVPIPKIEKEVLTSTNLHPKARQRQEDAMLELQIQLNKARESRKEGDLELAASMLISLLEAATPDEINREALFELARVSEEAGQFVRAQQIYAQYANRFPVDSKIPEIYLRRGLLYREMGASQLALTAFYSTMDYAIRFADKIEDYQRITLHAQTEIADTFFYEGDYNTAHKYYQNLLKQNFTELKKSFLNYKLVQTISFQGDPIKTVTAAHDFLKKYPRSQYEPEVRFLLARSLKEQNQPDRAAREVMNLLKAQKVLYEQDPRQEENWLYWQKRAGNEIGNSLYKDGEYQNALHVYLRLEKLSSQPAWQLPVKYQIGLCSEHLGYTDKARESYQSIMSQGAGLKGPGGLPSSLKTILRMSEWRLSQIQWKLEASSQSEALKNELENQLPPTTAQEESGMQSLAKIYSHMPPEIAVLVMKEMEDDLVINITRLMNSEHAAALFTAMADLGVPDARRAARLSEILSLEVAKNQVTGQ